MPFSITVTSEFCAAMQLSITGICGKLHGHTYQISAEFVSDSNNDHGISIDYHQLQQQLNAITNNLDHCHLNEHPWFNELAPSSENIAYIIYQELKKTSNKINKVSVSESRNCHVSYYE